jgi:hypothetical protein
LFTNQPKVQEISFTDFLNQVDRGKIIEVSINGDIFSGKLSDGKLFRTRA